MKREKNNEVLYSHTYIENDYTFQLFGKVLYAAKNLRRRLVLGAFNEYETMSDRDVQQYLKRKGFAEQGRSTIRNFYINPWVEARALEEQEKNSYKITAFGKDINGIISGLKELNVLPIPIRQRLHPEHILLELRDGRKTERELKLKLNIPDAYKVIKRFRNAGFIKMNRPDKSLYVTGLTHFTISPYYYFIQSLKKFGEKTKRNWFTEYSVVTHLNLRWKEKFGRPMNLEECSELLKKGIELGDITKTDGSYTITSIKDLTLSERKIFALVEEDCDLCSAIAEKSGFHWWHVYRILRRLERKGVIEKKMDRVTIELTEKGRRLADCLFKIKECMAKEVG